MQNNLIRIPRKAFRRASQDRTTLKLPINERQALLAAGCMLSRWSEASLMRCQAGNGKSKSEIVGGGTDNDSLGGGGERGGDEEGMNGLIDCNAYSLADCWPEFPVRLRRLRYPWAEQSSSELL
jgi:hypothetical protein